MNSMARRSSLVLAVSLALGACGEGTAGEPQQLAAAAAPAGKPAKPRALTLKEPCPFPNLSRIS